jgi:hypothetical protein
MAKGYAFFTHFKNATKLPGNNLAGVNEAKPSFIVTTMSIFFMR